MSGTRDTTVLITIDLDEVSSSHDRGQNINPQADRRSDVYALTVEGNRL
jgi:hypothetical protein